MSSDPAVPPDAVAPAGPDRPHRDVRRVAEASNNRMVLPAFAALAVNGLLPQRTYLLDMDPEQSHRRLQHARDRMESVDAGFQSRTRRAFLQLAQAEPQRFLKIDAERPADAVWSLIRDDFDALVQRQRSCD